MFVAFVSLTAAAQPVPEISLSAIPEPSWRIGKVTKYQFFPAQSSGINTVPSQSATGSAVYNLQGLKVGDSLKGLPVGIYIVKQGGKSFKVVKEK